MKDSESVAQRTFPPPAQPRTFTRWQRLQVRLASWTGEALIRLIGSTLRFRVEGMEHFETIHAQGRPAILSFWHSQIFAATYFWRNRGIVVITSQHFDGEYIARIIGRFGYGTARGSSTRGAVGALLSLRTRLRQGRDVAFTIDGPKGPREQVKPGPIWLSRKSQSPILCFHIQPRRFWEFGTWDRMRIPKPFTHLLVKIGEPIQVPEQCREDQWLAAYQAEMMRLQRYCEEKLASGGEA